MQVLFSSYIVKTNRYNKPADRVLLVTDLAIYKLDGHKFKPMKRGMPIAEVLHPENTRITFIESMYLKVNKNLWKVCL